MAVPIDVLECTHGNERLGLVLHELLKNEHQPGVRSRIAHPEAVKRGVRHIGPGRQLQQHYPGSRSGDIEDRAAYRNMRWLGKHVDNPECLIYDVHNTDVLNFTAFSIGKRALRATMVGAWLLGYDKCYLIDDPFRRAVPNAAILENGIDPPEYPTVAEHLHRGITSLALTNTTELLSHYDEMISSVRFYTKHEIPTVGKDGSVQSFIPSLETVRSVDVFTPLPLSAEQRALLDIPSDAGEVLAESWGHQNMSKIFPTLGETAEGVPRRAWFGGYLLPAEPPVVSGEWAIHGSVPRL